MTAGRPRLPIWDKVQEEYVAGNHDLQDLCKKYGLSRMGIVKAMKRAGVYVPFPVGSRPGSVPGNFGKSKYTVDSTVFDQVTPESAYWVGFLLTDGAVMTSTGNKQSVLSLELKTADGAHVQKLADFCKSDFPLSTNAPRICLGYKNTGSVSTQIRSTALVDSLQRFNIYPRKTHTCTAPDSLLLDRNFWRGVIDGDGSLGIRTFTGPSSSSSHPLIVLVGTQTLCAQFATFVHTLADTTRTIKQRKGMLWYFSLSGNPAQAVCNYLYQPGDVALERKAQLAEQIKALPLTKKYTMVHT